MKRILLLSGWALTFIGYALPFLRAQTPNQQKSLSTRYVECVRDARGQDIASRTAQTNVFASRDGSKSYGIVTAKHRYGGGCENITKIYLADEHGSFRVRFQQGPESLPTGELFDGNGVEAIRWSPSGKRLVAEVTQWTWGTDFAGNTKYIMFRKNHAIPQHLFPEEAISQQFPQACQMNIDSVGSSDDTHIAFNVSPSRDVDDEGVPIPTPSCVDKVTRFDFDVISQRLRPEAH